MCGIYCWNSTLQNKTKQDKQQAEDEMLKVSEVYLQAAPSQDSNGLWKLRKVKQF